MSARVEARPDCRQAAPERRLLRSCDETPAVSRKSTPSATCRYGREGSSCDPSSLDLPSRALLSRREGRRQPLPHHLARRRRHDRPGDRPDPAAAPVRGARAGAPWRMPSAAIRTMIVRGAPLIGAAAAYGMALAMASDASDAMLAQRLHRPDGIAPDRGEPALGARRPAQRCWRRCRRPSGADAAYRRAAEICDEDVEICRRIGETRARPDPQASSRKRRPHQRPDPLQRRLARHRRLGHRAGADLPGARCRHPDPRLGRRDPARATRAPA